MTLNTPELSEWNACLEGSPDAFGSVYDRHRARVYRHACRYAECREDAEDILAVAFLELWRLRSKVRLVDGSVLPWLLVTTTNVALNQRRGLRRYRDFLNRLPRDASEPDAAEVALSSIDLNVDPRLLTLIRSLRRQDQELLGLIALEGYSLRDASSALGITEAAARSRWQRIRNSLTTAYPGHLAQRDTLIGDPA